MAVISTIFRALLRKGALVGVIVLLLIGLVELFLWLFMPVSPYVTHRYTFQNNMKPLGLPSESVFEVDARELRKRPPAEDREETVKILIVGGEGNYQPLQSVEDTWWGRMAAALEKRYPEAGIEVGLRASPAGARVAAGSTALRSGISWSKAHVPEIDPDILVVAFGVSEVLDILPDYQYNPTAVNTLPAASRFPGWKDKMVRLSQVARRLRHGRHARATENDERRSVLEAKNHFLRVMGNQRSVYETLPFDVSPPRRTDPSRDPSLEYLDGLKAFQRLAERNDASLVVLTEPTLHDDLLSLTELGRLKRPRWLKRPTPESPNGSGLRPDPAWVERELTRYYDAGEDWAVSADVPFVDLNRETVLPKSVENFVDDTMLTQAGSERVKDEVLPVFDSLIKKFLAK